MGIKINVFFVFFLQLPSSFLFPVVSANNGLTKFLVTSASVKCQVSIVNCQVSSVNCQVSSAQCQCFNV